MKKTYTEKLWTLMKIGSIQLLLATITWATALALPSHAQLLEQKISLNLSEVPLIDALAEIETKAAIKFAYSNDQIGEEKISIYLEKTPLQQVLEEIFTPHNIRFIVHEKEKTIILKKEKPEKSSNRSEVNYTTPLGKDQIEGTVTDSNKQPLAGVNILIKGTTNGTTTDAEGKYSLFVNEGDVVTFSFIGFTSQSITISGQTVIDIILAEDMESLNEVVVNAGYWEVKDIERTGNISRLDAGIIEKQPISNPLQAMQGRMPGVYIQQTTGMPGGGFNIQIRGQNSLRNGIGGTVNGNLPLYIIDGVPFTSTPLTSPSITSSNLRGGNPLSTINPNDIESIEVLKDADATAIYGSRGANGVVLITTKRAKAGKTDFTMDLSQGIGQVASSLELLNTQQYLTMRKEAIGNDGLAELLTNPVYDVYWHDLKTWDTTRYTNWQKELIGGTANISNAQLSIAGGSEKTRFLVGGSYYRESTVFPGENKFQRGSGRVNITHESNNGKFRLSVGSTYSTSINNIPAGDFTAQAISLPPNAPALYSDGKLNWENGTWTNPLSNLERKYDGRIENYLSNISIGYEILENLWIRSSAGVTAMRVNETSTNPLTAYDPDQLNGRTGSSSFGESKMNTWLVEPQVEYTKTLGKGTIVALVGTTFQQSLQTGQTIQAYGYTNDALLENINAASSIVISDFNDAQYRYAALFTRLNYNWNDKYIVNLTGRRDGSSRFGPGKQFANFGAIGATWIFSNETFMQNLSFLSFGKLRSSYGITGSDAIGNYQYLNSYSPTKYPYNNSTGLTITRLSNPDYSWESNRKFETALEVGFFNNNLMLAAAFYLNRATDQLVGYPLPVITGQSSVQFNLPANVQNKGWEFAISAIPLKHNVFSWSVNFNISILSNQLLKFPDIENFPTYNNRFEVGKSVFIAKAYQYNGVDPLTGRYTFVDINDDGTISSPLDYIGNKEITQKFYGGIGNTLVYRNFELDFFFQFVNQTAYDYSRSFNIPGTMSNQPIGVMHRWQNPGDITDVQRFTFVDPDASVSTAYSRNLSSDHIIVDASFIRLKNISLTWRLPESWMEKVKMEGSKVFLQGQNILTFTNYLGLDPETQNSIALPPLRVVSVGIQAKF